MANINAPFGFRFKGILGASPNVELRPVTVDKDDTTAIFRGDPVKLLATGYAAQWTAATEVSQLAGIFVGCRYLDTASGEYVERPYWPGSGASEDVTAKIIPCNLGAPPTFIVQTSSGGAVLANLHANADVSLGTGNTRTGQSAAVLDMTTANTTATLPFRIMELYRGVGNGSDHTTGYNWVVVAANVAGAGSTGL